MVLSYSHIECDVKVIVCVSPLLTPFSSASPLLPPSQWGAFMRRLAKKIGAGNSRTDVQNNFTNPKTQEGGMQTTAEDSHHRVVSEDSEAVPASELRLLETRASELLAATEARRSRLVTPCTRKSAALRTSRSVVRNMNNSATLFSSKSQRRS